MSSLRSLPSDALFCSFPAMIFALLPYASIRALAVFLWCTIVASNMEYIIVNAANVSSSMWGYAMDESFIFGSLLVKSIFIRTLIFYVMIMALHHLLEQRIKTWCMHYFSPACVWLALVVIICLVPITPEVSNWQQMHAIEDNIVSAWQANQNVPSYLANQNMPRSVQPFYVKDLNGEPIIPLGVPRKTNVLMVVIEGLGDTHVRAGWLPNLNHIRSFGVYLSQYINASSITMNGMYALFCGDYPQMKTQMVTVNFARKQPALYKNDFEQRPCLPELLKKAGYSTVFLQGARLGYAKKGTFMQKAGFEERYGRESFGEEASFNSWGVSDRDLIEKAMEKATELSNIGKPWFLTAFNVGTHHPYNNIPEDFMPEKSGHERSMRYMDKQLNRLIQLFENSGLIKDTMLIITNDETHLPRSMKRTWGNQLSDNQGFMFIMLPEAVRVVNDGQFMQNDLPLSVLDYLGLDTSNMIGRSMFRKYTKDRPIYFGNPQGKRLYIKPDKDSIIICADGNICRLHALEAENIFASKLKPSNRSVGGDLARDILKFNDERYLHWVQRNTED
jgi:hypothetical protein